MIEPHLTAYGDKAKIMKIQTFIAITTCPRPMARSLRTACAVRLLPLLMLLTGGAAQAQFTFATNNGAIMITGYSGGGAVVIPSATNGYSITSIGAGAFSGSSVTSVTIPGGVTSIGSDAFSDCLGLTAVYFQGNAPSADSSVFTYDYNLTAVYYLSGATGWGATFAGYSAVEVAANYTVTVSASPGVGGTVSGGGTFAALNLQTVTATAANGYTFATGRRTGSWRVTADAYSFTLIREPESEANFAANPVTYTVTVSASPGRTAP